MNQKNHVVGFEWPQRGRWPIKIWVNKRGSKQIIGGSEYHILDNGQRINVSKLQGRAMSGRVR